MHDVTRKLNFDQISMTDTYTERHKCNQNHHILLQILALLAGSDSAWMILIIAVTKNGF